MAPIENELERFAHGLLTPHEWTSILSVCWKCRLQDWLLECSSKLLLLQKKKNPFGCNCQLFICRGEADEVGGGFAVRDISSQLNSITACNLFMTAIKASRPQWELKKITKLGQRCSKLTAMDNSEPRSTKAFEMHANRYAMLFGYKTASFPYKLASVQSKPFHQCLISQRKMLKKYITSYCNSSKIVYTVQ